MRIYLLPLFVCVSLFLLRNTEFMHSRKRSLVIPLLCSGKIYAERFENVLQKRKMKLISPHFEIYRLNSKLRILDSQYEICGYHFRSFFFQRRQMGKGKGNFLHRFFSLCRFVKYVGDTKWRQHEWNKMAVFFALPCGFLAFCLTAGNNNNNY